MLASDLPAWFVLVTAFLLGATWGSFFNVAIHRWPREMSVVSPPSHCPACQAPIPGWRNVPILAYLLQRGRAACCGAPMTPRYVVVELTAGVAAVAIANRWVVHALDSTSLGAAGLEAALWFTMVGGLLIATFVDLEWLEIPDEVSIGGTALALCTVAFRPGIPIEEIALGAGGAYLTVELLLVWSWERLTGERGMGEGDAKLAMFIGAFLGWRGALFALVAGCVQGIAGYAIARATGTRLTPSRDHAEGPETEAAPGPAPAERKPASAEPAPAERKLASAEPASAEPAPAEPAPAASAKVAPEAGTGERDPDAAENPRWIPFGPFLALGAIEFLFFGETIVAYYLSLFE